MNKKKQLVLKKKKLQVNREIAERTQHFGNEHSTKFLSGKKHMISKVKTFFFFFQWGQTLTGAVGLIISGVVHSLIPSFNFHYPTIQLLVVTGRQSSPTPPSLLFKKNDM